MHGERIYWEMVIRIVNGIVFVKIRIHQTNQRYLLVSPNAVLMVLTNILNQTFKKCATDLMTCIPTESLQHIQLLY